MSKNTKKRRIPKGLWIALFISIALFIGVVVMIVIQEKNNTEINQIVEEKDKKIEFPYVVEGTNITVGSLSQASVPNPDSDGSLKDDIACIEVKNNGETYISNIEVILEMQDGTEFNFKITDMPAGSLVQAFDVNNTVYNEENECEKITVENLTEEVGNQLMEDLIQVNVDETVVTLTNITGEALENISVVCHCDMDGSYFGGRSYTYTVESIPAGGSINIDASECYLGQSTVVRIQKNN